jgi:hypothetical protein
MTQINLKNGISHSQMGLLLGLLHSWNIEAEVVGEKDFHTAITESQATTVDAFFDALDNRIKKRFENA